jgi:predicted small lipoprotein YifL
MLSDLTGRRPSFKAVSRGGLLAVGLVFGLGLSACTTTEGTNALSDVGTFEREVLTETMKGMGMMDREEKAENAERRGPLVLPKSNASLPAPQDAKADQTASLLPEDSSRVQIDTSNLSEEDLKRLRNARVVDLRTLNGRPLTEVETKQLTARMTAAKLKGGPRPLYLPPDSYYTTVKGQDMVCLAASGELVPLTDKSCPPEVRKALTAQAQ